MIFNDYESHQARWDKLDKNTDKYDEWIIHEDKVMIVINEPEMMKNAERMVNVNLRNMFDRIDTEDGPIFQNVLEVVAYFKGDRLWSIVDIDEKFLKKLGHHQSIRFGTPEKYYELFVNRDEDLKHVLETWAFFRNDDEYFKAKNRD